MLAKCSFFVLSGYFYISLNSVSISQWLNLSNFRHTAPLIYFKFSSLTEKCLSDEVFQQEAEGGVGLACVAGVQIKGEGGGS